MQDPALALIAKILIYFVGLENARRHWMRVIVLGGAAQQRQGRLTCAN
jgi:hypothetical protein